MEDLPGEIGEGSASTRYISSPSAITNTGRPAASTIATHARSVTDEAIK